MSVYHNDPRWQEAYLKENTARDALKAKEREIQEKVEEFSKQLIEQSTEKLNKLRHELGLAISARFKAEDAISEELACKNQSHPLVGKVFVRYKLDITKTEFRPSINERATVEVLTEEMAKRCRKIGFHHSDPLVGSLVLRSLLSGDKPGNTIFKMPIELEIKGTCFYWRPAENEKS